MLAKDVHIILGAPKVEDIKPLIQSPGLVIGVDRGAIIAIDEKIKLDIALGDFDSVLKDEKRKVNQYSDKVFNFSVKKDDTDTELALLYVLNNLDVENIYLYNWQGGRVDHSYSLAMIVLQKRFLSLVPKIKFISKYNYISYYLAGKHVIQKKEEMEYLSLILLTKIEKLTLSEVIYPLKEAKFSMPRALISNEFIGEKAILSFKEGIIGVIQSRDMNKK